jgi:hypothetical protein
LILPYARQAAKLARPPPEFRSNTHLLLKRPPRHNVDSASTLASSKQPGPVIEETMPETEQERGEPMSGFMAFKALGIATAVVFGSAGLGAFVVAKLLGVDSVRALSSFYSFGRLSSWTD